MSTNHPNSMQPIDGAEEEINLLDLLIVLVKYKKTILGVTFGTAVLAAAISLLMPNVYTATARILPPQQNQSSASILLSQLGGVTGLAGASLGQKSPSDIYVSMLQSRNVMEKVATRFDLLKAYDKQNMEDMLQELNSRLAVQAGNDGIISVSVDDIDSKRAADMANVFIEELDKLLNMYSLAEAAKRKTFFEQQLKQERDKLTEAELLLDRTPPTSLHYINVIRDFKYHEGIYNTLASQYAAAQLDESKNYPVVQVLDKALPSERKSKPKRAMIVIFATGMAGFLVLILVVMREAFLRAEMRPDQVERLSELRRVSRWKSG